MEECENGCIPCTAEILKLWLVKYNISTGGRGIAVVKATGAESASRILKAEGSLNGVPNSYNIVSMEEIDYLPDAGVIAEATLLTQEEESWK
jgi:hypothetical protein|nr:MAG TPA: hypothetical protein [Bacteriophage sp.]